ncbi:MAG: 3-hydroxyacyl-CoA dehydrogenase NAD-binding domain-containing protein [Pseudomonadota bacterium]
MSDIFPLSIDADGVATLSWDLPGARMNVLTETGILELEEKLPRILSDPSVKGVILTSAKADFAGGMDLPTILAYKRRAMEQETPAAMLFSFVMRVHALLRLIELGGSDTPGKPGKPVVWASPGTAVGIGTELALACHRRIAAANPKARIGLPEIKVGLFPGSGGTTRLIRMLGLLSASEYLLEGRIVAPDRAVKAGLIDEIVPPEELLARAREYVLSAPQEDLIKPWDRKGFKLPGGLPYSPAGFPNHAGAVALVHGKTQGVYPAAKAMLSAIYEGAALPFNTAIRIEARWFTKILLNPSAEAMIRTLFVNKQRLEKGAARPHGASLAPIRRLGVIGAGMMGAGIAQVAARAGIQTVMLDRDLGAAERGRTAIAARLDQAVTRKRLTPEDQAETMSRLEIAADMHALAGCDLVVEAVFEDTCLKRDVLACAAAAMAPDAILASNTSTLPISSLAASTGRPARFCGIHFFSPVDRMLLVEVIRGPGTAPETVSRALDLVAALGKTPIVVNDARFFYANRCILPYGQEGVQMLAEGINPALIENAARQAGMPVGPLQLTDETALDLADRIAAETCRAGYAAPDPAAALIADLVHRHGRLGRKSGAGFYDYETKGKRIGLWSGLADLCPLTEYQPALAEIQDRLLYSQALEALRALEEGVIEDPRDADVAAVLGWGFAPWSGGPFSWVDMQGAGAVLARAEDLAARHGPRFTPPQILRRAAERTEPFYARFDPLTTPDFRA